MAQMVPPRAEIPREHIWATESIFATDADWEAEREAVSRLIPSLAWFQGRLADGPAALADYLETYEEVLRRLGKVFVYASLFYAVDATDQTAAARSDQARGLYARVMAAASFAEPEMLALGAETLARWQREESRLAIYVHYFDQLLKRAEHVRSAEVEEVLRQAGEPFSTASATHGILVNADLTYGPAQGADGSEPEITQGTIAALLTDPDREVRRTAWQGYADAHLSMKNTLANCLAAGVKQDVFFARARRYESSLEASLTPNQIPVAVFHNLIAAFQANLPTWHRYWRLRRRALGYETLHVYDIKAPLTAATPVVPYARAVEWIAEGMKPLGEEYVAVLRRGATEERWVDKYPNKGKRQGAFSSGVPGTHPFIMMSYNDDVFSMSTLAHELGHSLHSYYSWQTQPLVYSRYSLFVAEVASNFNQTLVRAHLLETEKDRDLQITLIEEAMANFHRYFFIMPTLARFELEIHERVERGEALTAARLITLMTDLFREGYGDAVEIDADRVGSTWMQFASHLYSNFYVYQYATGISGAHALAERVLTEGRPAVDDYLAFLKAGGSLYPLDALHRAGVDLSTPAPVEKTFAVLAEMVQRLEGLV